MVSMSIVLRGEHMLRPLMLLDDVRDFRRREGFVRNGLATGL